MTIEKKLLGTTVELNLSGWLDTQSAPELEAELDTLTSDITVLVLECSELEYISSAGLRELVSAHKKMKGELTLRHVSSEIMGVIRMTGLDKRLRFE